MKKNTQKYIFYTLAVCGGLFTLYNKLPKSHVEQVNYVNEIKSESTNDLDILNTDFEGLSPINWTRGHIPAKTLTKIANGDAPDNIASYLIVRFPFMSGSELSASLELVETLNMNDDNEYYANCLLNNSCDYEALLVEYPKSKWSGTWKENVAIEGLQKVSNDLNLLNSNVIPGKHLKALTTNTQFGEIVHPRATEIVVVTPYYDNCSQNAERLVEYLQAIKVKYSMLSDIADSYLADAIDECV